MQDQHYEVEKGANPLENEQHERFCLEMLEGKSKTQAYLRAFPDSSYDSARASSSRLFADVNIQERIEYLKKEQRERLKLDADRVLLEVSKLAFSNIRDLFREDGTLIALEELDPDVAAAVASYEVEELTCGAGDSKRVIGRRVKIKLADKYRGLELLGRNLKLWTDKLEIRHRITLEEILAEVPERSDDRC